MTSVISVNGRLVGEDYPPLVIAEIGINHEGDLAKAIKMVDDARKADCECVKFQCHIIEDEMIPKARSVLPGNADESIWDIIARCSLREDEEVTLKKYVESKGMVYLSTPFSRAAADRLEKMGVCAYKIGSGECNNYPLIEHIVAYRKPVILSTGMNDIPSIAPAVEILRKSKIPFALMHCTSMYPTPYEKVRLGALTVLKEHFSDAVIGLSDHSLGIYTSLASVILGASILEKHFTSDATWPGPDISISITPEELRNLIEGSRAIHKAKGGEKDILSEEQPTIDFAYASIVSIRDIEKGDQLTMQNIWVKRPGSGGMQAKHFSRVLKKKAKVAIKKDEQLRWEQIEM